MANDGGVIFRFHLPQCLSNISKRQQCYGISIILLSIFIIGNVIFGTRITFNSDSILSDQWTLGMDGPILPSSSFFSLPLLSGESTSTSSSSFGTSQQEQMIMTNSIECERLLDTYDSIPKVQRRSNAIDSGITYDIATSMIQKDPISSSSIIFDQTICHEQSLVRNEQQYGIHFQNVFFQKLVQYWESINVTIPPTDAAGLSYLDQRKQLLNLYQENVDNDNNRNNNNDNDSSLRTRDEYEFTFDRLINDWEFKLIYLAIHDLCHRPARKEHKQRQEYCPHHPQMMQQQQQEQQNQYPSKNEKENDNEYTATPIVEMKEQSTSSSSTSKSTNRVLPPYDYDCSNAKFFVAPLHHVGMGATMRIGAVDTIQLAVMSNRIPIFVSNGYVPEWGVTSPKTQYIPKFLKTPWSLASCERRDYQCIFLPTSPCSVTLAELANNDTTAILETEKMASLRRGLSLPSGYEEKRILVADSTPLILRPNFDKLREKIRKMIINLIKKWEQQQNLLRHKSHGYDKERELSWMEYLLQMAASKVMQEDSSDGKSFWYPNKTNKIAHAILLYILRPNIKTRQELERRLKVIFPYTTTTTATTTTTTTESSSFQPELAVGMPIRASDKCGFESGCLTLDQQMKLAIDTWDGKEGSNSNLPSVTTETTPRGNLIVTTEDLSVYKKIKKYLYQRNRTTVSSPTTSSASASTSTLPFDVIINHDDIFQSTGRAKLFLNQADEIIRSSLLALQMQFHSGMDVYGNCCSNFHMMMFDLLHDGCGLLSTATRTTTTSTPSSNKPQQRKPICLQETNNIEYHLCCAWTKNKKCDGTEKKEGTEEMNNDNNNGTSTNIAQKKHILPFF